MRAWAQETPRDEERVRHGHRFTPRRRTVGGDHTAGATEFHGPRGKVAAHSVVRLRLPPQSEDTAVTRLP